MGKKGRPKSSKKGGGVLGGIASMAKGATKHAGGPSGMSSGLYRVSPNGSITKISKPKKRRPGFRMPRVIREQLEANRRLTEAVAMRVAAGHV